MRDNDCRQRGKDTDKRLPQQDSTGQSVSPDNRENSLALAFSVSGLLMRRRTQQQHKGEEVEKRRRNKENRREEARRSGKKRKEQDGKEQRQESVGR